MHGIYCNTSTGGGRWASGPPYIQDIKGHRPAVRIVSYPGTNRRRHSVLEAMFLWCLHSCLHSVVGGTSCACPMQALMRYVLIEARRNCEMESRTDMSSSLRHGVAAMSRRPMSRQGKKNSLASAYTPRSPQLKR
jgi:hypothetical protein